MSWHSSRGGDEGDAKPLREAIERYLNRGGHGEIALLAKVTATWESVVGSHVASHVRPVAISNDTLIVDVDQPAWSTEVAFIADGILAALEERLGEPVASFVKPRVRGRSGVE